MYSRHLSKPLCILLHLTLTKNSDEDYIIIPNYINEKIKAI